MRRNSFDLHFEFRLAGPKNFDIPSVLTGGTKFQFSLGEPVPCVDAREKLGNDTSLLIADRNLKGARALKLFKPCIGVCVLVNCVEDFLHRVITPVTANSVIDGKFSIISKHIDGTIFHLL